MIVAANRGGSRTAATSKMERFVIIVNGFQPLTIITKRSVLDVAAVLDPPLASVIIHLTMIVLILVCSSNKKKKVILQIKLRIVLKENNRGKEVVKEEVFVESQQIHVITS